MLWPLLAGLALGGGLILWQGKVGLWPLIALCLVAAAAALVVTFGSRRKPEQSADVTSIVGRIALAPLVREVFELLADPLMLLDTTGRVIFANTAMRRVIGVDWENKHISSLLRTPAVLEAISRTSQTGEESSVEFTVPVPVERTYAAYVARTQNKPELTTLLLHDLTAIKRSEQMRADFVANASHELRTPLAAVTGFIDTLKGHAREDPQARDRFLDIMSVEAARMRRLIEDLLSLTRIEMNEHVRPSGAVSLERVVKQAFASLGPLAQVDGIALEIDAPPNLPPVVGERDELVQLFQNLIHNAIKYGRNGGHVWVTLSQAPGAGGRGAATMIQASVRDDGEGIAADAIPRLTERFYRVDVKRSREKGGTGLGLAIVKHIVNRHQGRLQIESRAGEGSTFIVQLPVASADAAVMELL
ncbi:MAG TPA: ATP-binding protein [Rhizomicrobium sp.]|nr:ATP-binding protein [Rhizomicrobium sp.]